MADEATLRECAVCDVKTTSACGRCGLPFCSREHQKLLWKTHKWLCGKDPDVSSLPPLDEEEVEALLACSKSEGTLKDYLGQPISFADFEVFVESRLSTSWRALVNEPDDSSSPLPEAKRTYLLAYCHAFLVKARIPAHPEARLLPPTPWRMAGNFLTEFLEPWPLPCSEEYLLRLLNPFLRQLLTFTTLFKPPPFEQQEPLLSLSIARLDSPAQSIGGPSMLQLKKTAERLVRSIWEKTRAVGGG